MRRIVLLFALVQAIGCVDVGNFKYDNPCPKGEYARWELKYLSIPIFGINKQWYDHECFDCPSPPNKCSPEGTDKFCWAGGKCLCKKGYKGEFCISCEPGYRGTVVSGERQYCCPRNEYLGDDNKCKSCFDHCHKFGVDHCTSHTCSCKVGYLEPTCSLCFFGWGQMKYGKCCKPPSTAACLYQPASQCKNIMENAYCTCPECNPHGTKVPVCKKNGKCNCKDGYEGPTCYGCKPGWFKISNNICEPCSSCNPIGGESCKPTGCICKKGYEGEKCKNCTKGYYGKNGFLCCEYPGQPWCPKGYPYTKDVGYCDRNPSSWECTGGPGWPQGYSTGNKKPQGSSTVESTGNTYMEMQAVNEAGPIFKDYPGVHPDDP